MSLDSLSRPSSVECLSFENTGKGACAHYSKTGNCALAQIQICTEWAKRNPAEAAARSAASATPAHSKASHSPNPARDEPRPPQRRQLTLVDGMPPESPSAPANRIGAPATHPNAPANRIGASANRIGAPHSAAKPPDDVVSAADADALAERGYEMCVEGWNNGEDVWIVPTLTNADRIELTYRQAATLANMLGAFPNAKVKVIRDATPPTPVANVASSG